MDGVGQIGRLSKNKIDEEPPPRLQILRLTKFGAGPSPFEYKLRKDGWRTHGGP